MPYDPEMTVAEAMKDLKRRLSEFGNKPEVADARPEPLPDPLDNMQSIDAFTDPNDAASPSVFAGIDSTAWTGRRTLSEQKAIIAKFAPKALASIDELIMTTEDQRPNDRGQIEQLIEIRSSLNQLYQLNEQNADWSPSLKAVARATGHIFDEIDRQGNIIKNSTSRLFILMLLVCLLCGANPLFAVAGALGIKTPDGKAK